MGWDLLVAVHRRFGDDLKASILVGGTHWEVPRVQAELPGPTPAFFFAPDRIAKRRQDWAGGEFDRRYGEAWTPFVSDAARWLTVKEGQGPEAIRAAYLEQVEGGTAPDVGVVLRP